VFTLSSCRFPAQNTVLALIQARQPVVYAAFVYTYATVWFSARFLVLSAARSCVYIFVASWDLPKTSQPLPPYPAAETRENLFPEARLLHHSDQGCTAPADLVLLLQRKTNKFH
jgi:hypothetical protein